MDDIIYIGGAANLKISKKRIGDFERGNLEYPKPGNSLKYCGIATEVAQSMKVSSPKEEFYGEISPLHPKDLAVNNQMVFGKTTPIRRLESLVGYMIWVMIDRSDVVFIGNANRLITRLKAKRAPLTFPPFVNDSGNGRKAQVIAFPDASFGTLRGRGGD